MSLHRFLIVVLLPAELMGGVGVVVFAQQQNEAVVDECNNNNRDNFWILGDAGQCFAKVGDFLRENIFGQQEGDQEDPFSDLTKKKNDRNDEEEQSGGDENVFLNGISKMVQDFGSVFGKNDEDKPVVAEDDRFHSLTDLIETMVASNNNQQQPEQEPLEMILSIFWNATKRVHEHLEKTFFKDSSLVDNFDLNPLQVYYHMVHQEATKDGVFKRRVQHAFMPSLPELTAMQMADGLYLSQLAYVNDCDSIQQHLKSFHNDTWALLNCTVQGRPSQPAHFLAVQKVSSPLQIEPPTNWLDRVLQFDHLESKTEKKFLEVALVVRGTKELADMMSDGLLSPTNYRGGKAHEGILESGVWVYETYKDFLENLRIIAGVDKIRLWLVGHSLGAGTTALACMEFNQDPSINATIDAYALGFGTPAVVSKDLSEAAKDRITTVVNDDDCIPRMSGATIVNAWLEASTCESWIEESKADIRRLMVVMKERLPFPDFTEKMLTGVLDWLESIGARSKAKRQAIKDTVPPQSVLLMPPGECVHLYRDGSGWQGVFMPCSHFNEIEATRNLVSDHLINTGYYVGLLSYIRTLRNDLNWRFEPDLIELPIT